MFGAYFGSNNYELFILLSPMEKSIYPKFIYWKDIILSSLTPI